MRKDSTPAKAKGLAQERSSPRKGNTIRNGNVVDRKKGKRDPQAIQGSFSQCGIEGVWSTWQIDQAGR